MHAFEPKSGLIKNRSHAIVAVFATAIITASAVFIVLEPVVGSNPWDFDALHLPQPLMIGLSVFFWVFTLWVLFWFYRAAREKYEQFLVGAFAAAFVLGVVRRFVPSAIAANLQLLRTAAAIISFAAAMTLLFRLPSENPISQQHRNHD